MGEVEEEGMSQVDYLRLAPEPGRCRAPILVRNALPRRHWRHVEHRRPSKEDRRHLQRPRMDRAPRDCPRNSVPDIGETAEALVNSNPDDAIIVARTSELTSSRAEVLVGRRCAGARRRQRRTTRPRPAAGAPRPRRAPHGRQVGEGRRFRHRKARSRSWPLPPWRSARPHRGSSPLPPSPGLPGEVGGAGSMAHALVMLEEVYSARSIMVKCVPSRRRARRSADAPRGCGRAGGGLRHREARRRRVSNTAMPHSTIRAWASE